MQNLLLSLLAALALLTQSAPVPEKLSDSYGKAAFLATKAIRRDASETLSKDTQTAIDAADAEATSPAELRMTKSLKHVAVDKMINNLSRKVIFERYEAKLILATPAQRSAIEEQMKIDPKLKNIQDREVACFDPLEETFRAREARFPAACESMTEKK